MDDYGPTVKGFLSAVLRAAAFAIGLILVMFIAGYYNENLMIDWVGGLVGFLKTYWAIISGFLLLISVWEYFYPFYKEKVYIKYVKPLMDSVGLTFGLWLVVEFISALSYFIPDAEAVQVLGSFKEIFFMYFVWIFLLIIFINYAKMLLEDNRADKLR